MLALLDYFTGEDPGITLREWLPSLQNAADWNEWSNKETFIQLAGAECYKNGS